MPVKFSDFSGAGGDGNWGVLFIYFFNHSEMSGSLCFLCHFIRPVHQMCASVSGAQSEVCCPSRRSLGLMFRS